MTWKRYIEWERSNPLKLEDKNQLTARVLHAYKRALIMLRMFPALWHEASTYLTEVGKNDEALAILKSGTEALPTSSLLHLSLADLYESRGQVPAAKALYEGLVENLEKQITGINSRAEGEKARAVGAVQAAIKAGALDGEEREDKRLKEKAAVEKVEAARAKEVGEVREALALTWVFYMRFARRTENIKAARAVFSRARKSPNCLPHVFVASALMEHYISKDPQVAGRIFELGLKSVPEGNGELLVPYISEYLDWLISQNDDNSEFRLGLTLNPNLTCSDTRALFERSLLAVPPAQARQIWSKFTAYEVQFGDLASLLRVEKRRAEAFPEDAYHMAGLVDLADRYTYLDLTVVRDRELGLQALQGLDKAIALKPKPRATSASTSDARQSADTGEGKAKGPLDPFHPERFPRPDFGRYTVHKTDKAAPQRPNPPGMIISVPLPPKPTTPSLAVPSSGKQGAVPTGPMIPELIATLISALPPAHAYTGKSFSQFNADLS
jgi:cleavage stimulation factor subunit 3